MGNIEWHTRMKNDDTESLPIKALVDELQDLRSEVRQAVESYASEAGFRDSQSSIDG